MERRYRRLYGNFHSVTWIREATASEQQRQVIAGWQEKVTLCSVKKGLNPEEALSEARNRGTLVDDWCNRYLLGDSTVREALEDSVANGDYADVGEYIQPLISRLPTLGHPIDVPQRWMYRGNRSGSLAIGSKSVQLSLCHPDLKYAGTLDFVLSKRGDHCLYDLTTNGRHYLTGIPWRVGEDWELAFPEYNLSQDNSWAFLWSKMIQVAAYKLAFERVFDVEIHKLAILVCFAGYRYKRDTWKRDIAPRLMEVTLADCEVKRATEEWLERLSRFYFEREHGR